MSDRQALIANRSAFLSELRLQFYPVLKRLGFKGGGQTRRRISDNAFNIVHLWADRYGGMIYVDIGIHFPFLPREGAVDAAFDFSRLREENCSFRSRLLSPTEFEGELHWGAWGYGVDQASATLAAYTLSKLFEERMEPELKYFSNPEHIADKLTLEMIGAREYGDFNWCGVSGGPALALTMARLNLYLGRRADALKFAQYGIEQTVVNEQRVELSEFLLRINSSQHQ